MTRTFEVITPEQVAIQYELAGVGSRGLAALADYLIIFSLTLPVIYFLGKAASAALEQGLSQAANSYFGLCIFAFFFINSAYYIAFEHFSNGQTPGKRVLGLRVIKDGGYPVDFRAILIRNLVRLVDVLPGTYSFGFVVVLINPQYKRLGDLAAGTIVIRHGREEEARRFMLGEALVFRLFDAAQLSMISRITREEYALVQRFIERRIDLPRPLQDEFARRLAQPMIEKLDYRVPDTGLDYQRWLEELELAYRSRAHGATFAAPPPIATAAPPPVDPVTPSDTRKW